MKQILLFLATVCIGFTTQANAQYTDGVFILNEDWFGHQNSTINFWHVYDDEDPTYIDYRIFQQANYGYSLGCTAQFGTVYGGKLFVISKQDQDFGQGPDTQGARLVVADAKNMHMLYRQANIFSGPDGGSLADGRSFVGVDESTGYIGTSNGIFVLNLNTMMVEQRIAGTENPLITGWVSNDDVLGPLYKNQIGTMLRTQDYVFAIQQDKGVLVINPKTHQIETVIEGCFSSMVQSKDGYVWVGKNSNMENNGKYQVYPYGDNGSDGEKWKGDELLRIDPVTLDTEIKKLSQGGINQSWYAWTSGSFVASTHTNDLYFVYRDVKSASEWFNASKVYRYNIDAEEVNLIYNSQESMSRYIYTGGGVAISPYDNSLFLNLYLGVNEPDYWFTRHDISNMKVLNEKQPSKNYWFPAMVIFPDVYDPEVSEISDVTVPQGATHFEIDLTDVATDRDNLSAAIVKTVKSISNPELFSASIQGNILSIYPKDKSGTAQVTLKFNSNGKVVEKGFAVTVSPVTSNIEDVVSDEPIFEYYSEGVFISNLQSASDVEVYTLSGRLVHKERVSGESTRIDLSKGQTYILKIGDKRSKITL